MDNVTFQKQPQEAQGEQPVILSQPRQLLVKKKTLRLIIGIAIIVVLGGGLYIGHASRVSQQNKQTLLYRTNAQNAFDKGDYAQTEKDAAAGLKIMPSNKDLLHLMLSSLAADGNNTKKEAAAYQKAQPYITEALKVGSNDPVLLTDIGYLNEIVAKYPEAMSNYNKAIDIDSHSAAALFHRGHTEAFLNQTANSTKDYNASYELNSNNPVILIVKGNESTATGKLDQATALYMKAAAQPNVPPQTKAEAYTDAAIVKQMQLLYPDQALSLAKQAVAADPTYSPALGTYGFDQAFMGDYVNGLQNLDKAIQADPNRTANYLMKGQIDRLATRYRAAATDFTQGLAHVSSDNTLVGDSVKQRMKAQLTYEQAKNYAVSNNLVQNIPQIIGWLQEAIALEPSYKTYLKNDYTKSTIFTNISQNAQFQTFIKTII